ncbi:MAG TPA: hypothetical protein VFZ34_10690 [Blastocatellia bacterium]|nr:hypothetical protein [Blastocatellia bacterium]
MLKAKIIVIAMLSLFMTAAALAQPTQKRTAPQKSVIWGHETNYGVQGTARKPRPKDFSFGCSNPTAVGTQRTRSQKPRNRVNATSGIIGGLGSAVLGIQKPRARQVR